jgi:hypothetical protein
MKTLYFQPDSEPNFEDRDPIAVRLNTMTHLRETTADDPTNQTLPLNAMKAA